jgi:hypothetical protein
MNSTRPMNIETNCTLRFSGCLHGLETWHVCKYTEMCPLQPLSKRRDLRSPHQNPELIGRSRISCNHSVDRATTLLDLRNHPTHHT